jgi:hypothetical protein
MTQPTSRKAKSANYQTLHIPHKLGCGLTKLTDGQVTLHRLGLFPVRCQGCGDMMPFEKGRDA